MYHTFFLAASCPARARSSFLFPLSSFLFFFAAGRQRADSTRDTRRRPHRAPPREDRVASRSESCVHQARPGRPARKEATFSSGTRSHERDIVFCLSPLVTNQVTARRQEGKMQKDVAV